MIYDYRVFTKRGNFCNTCILPGASVPEHLSEALLLVGAQHGRGLQVDVDVGVHRVVAEVVLCQ